MNRVALTVVVPTKNRLQLLRRAVDSVISQPYRDWELIIVNDGSTDGTRGYLERMVIKDARIRAIHRSTSGGVNAARNAAFAQLRGNGYVCCLDDDDYFVPDGLQRIVDALAAMPPKISIACFNSYNLTKDTRYEQGLDFEPREVFTDRTYFEVMTKARITGDSIPVFSVGLFVEKGAYRYFEDINGFESEVFMLMARDGVGIRYFPQVVAYKDHSHADPHLSDYAARGDPASFVRAHRRIFRDHVSFFARYPRLAMGRAVSAMKLAVRARDLASFAWFGFIYARSLVRVPFAKRIQDEP